MKNPFDNPVFWLDSRARVRERRLWMLASFFLAVPLAIALLLLFTMVKPDNSAFPIFGKVLATVAVFSHGALLILLSALGAAQRISQERERRTLPALVNSPLNATRIADGKLLGAWRFTAWLAFLTLPFLAAASLWGGHSTGEMLSAWLLNLAAAMATASLALGLSGLFGRSLSAYLATGAVLFFWCAVVPVVGGILGSAANLSGRMEDWLFPAVAFLHLPLAPQVWVFADGFDGAIPWYVVFPVALSVWGLLCLFGRWLAIRGLRREVF